MQFRELFRHFFRVVLVAITLPVDPVAQSLIILDPRYYPLDLVFLLPFLCYHCRGSGLFALKIVVRPVRVKLLGMEYVVNPHCWWQFQSIGIIRHEFGDLEGSQLLVIKLLGQSL